MKKDGQTYFLYADSKDCRCLYVGTERAYQAYVRLATERKLGQEQLEAAEDWDNNWYWGSWGPWHGGDWAPFIDCHLLGGFTPTTDTGFPPR